MNRILLAVLTALLGCALFASPTSAAPTINSAAVAPALVAPGDTIHVIANVTDTASTVTGVVVNETALSPTNGDNWEGDVPVDPALGEHSITITAQNAAAATTTLPNAARYMTTAIFGINGNAALHALSGDAASRYLFRVWGKAKFVDENTFTVSDGSLYPIKVISTGHTVANDDIVWARGILDDTNAPPALLRYGQYSIIKMGPRKAITISDVNIGKDLQTSDSGTLPTMVPYGGSLNVTISSSDPTKVLLSKSATTPGSGTIILTVPGGSTSIPTFYVQALAGSGTVDIVATAPGGLGKVFKANLYPSGFGMSTSNFSTTAFAANTSITVRPGRLNPTTSAVIDWQPLRAGLTGVSVPVTSSDTAVGTITISPLVFTPNVGSMTTQFDPIGAGESDVSLSQPAGFSTPSTHQLAKATVTASDITGSDVNVGLNLQTSSSCYLGATPPTPVEITVSVESDTIATLSKTATAEGTGSLTFSDISGTGSQTFYIQGRKVGSTKLTFTAPGYNTRTRTITVTPSGFCITTSSFNTTSFSANTTITVRPARLNLTTLAVVEYQPLRAGFADTNVEVSSSNTDAGVITTSPVVFTPNVSSLTTQFDPVGAGSSTISIVQPEGFAVPSASQSITATVTAADVNGSDVNVGKELQTSSTCSLGATPPAPVEITVSVGADSVATLSKSATTEGTGSVTFSNVSSTAGQTFYVQGRSIGSTTLTISAPGYNTRTRIITVAPSGFCITTSSFNTTSFSANTSITVRSVRLNASTLSVAEYQPLRGGSANVDVSVLSSDTAVGTITVSPLSFAQNVSSINTQFDPLGAGVATLSVVTPAGFTAPSVNQSITATVTMPDTAVSALTVGRDLQDTNYCSLGAAPPAPVDITVTVAKESVAKLSKSATTEGSASITFSNISSTSSQTFYVQGISLGTTDITVSAPGYNSRTRTITVDPSGFVIVSPTSISTTATAANSNVQIKPARLNPSNFTYVLAQPLRGGLAPVSVDVVSSNTGVGTIKTSPLVFNPNVTSLTTQFDPLAQGTTTISVEPPAGFSTPTTYRQITATVNQ